MNQYDLFKLPERQKIPPRQLATSANWEAKRIFRLIKSWQTELAKIRRIVNQPGIQELVEATDIRKFIGYILTVMFVVGLFVEWNFSAEVYESQSSTAILFFLGLVLAGLYASACFNTLVWEFRSRITNRPESQDFYEVVYEREGKPEKLWHIFHPVNGFVVFLIVEFIVYHLSSQRIVWQSELSQNATGDLWLPCIWFFLEVLFGMGAHYTAERLFVSHQHRKYEKKLSEGEDEIKRRTKQCLEAWDSYSEAMDAAEQKAMAEDLPLPDRVQANPHLKMLIHLENSSDGDFLDQPVSLPPAL